jgi:hypothetical protein
MSEAAEKSLRCPYCGCGFEPAEPGQEYCSPFCELEHRKQRERAGGAVTRQSD